MCQNFSKSARAHFQGSNCTVHPYNHGWFVTGTFAIRICHLPFSNWLDFQEDKSRVEIYRDYAKKKKENIWSPFLNLLNRPDGFIQNMTARIIAKLACWSRDQMDGSDLVFYLTWLKDQLLVPGNEYIQTTARCLQMMLRDEKYRLAFANMGGVSTLGTVLSGRINFQV